MITARGSTAPSRPSRLITGKIHVDAFSIDTHEVTNADYVRFADATRAARPWNWAGRKVAKGEERFPVSNVNWDFLWRLSCVADIR